MQRVITLTSLIYLQKGNMPNQHQKCPLSKHCKHFMSALCIVKHTWIRQNIAMQALFNITIKRCKGPYFTPNQNSFIMNALLLAALVLTGIVAGKA